MNTAWDVNLKWVPPVKIGVCSVMPQSGTTLETEVSVWVVLDCTGGFCPQLGLRASVANASHARTAVPFLSPVPPLSAAFQMAHLAWAPALYPFLSHHPESKALGVGSPEQVLSSMLPRAALSFHSFSSTTPGFVWKLAFLNYKPERLFCTFSDRTARLDLTSSPSSLCLIFSFILFWFLF